MNQLPKRRLKISDKEGLQSTFLISIEHNIVDYIIRLRIDKNSNQADTVFVISEYQVFIANIGNLKNRVNIISVNLQIILDYALFHV